jgi:hypothetical protein
VRSSLIGAVTLAAVCALAGAAPVQTRAVNGPVTVFSTEIAPLAVITNPDGCYKLPVDAHVLTNQTDGPVTLYADPFCATPSLTVQPGYGSHVAAGTGSFAA